MKKIVFWTALSAFIMFALPWLAVTFIKGDGGMAACFLLFFAVNPVFSVILGASAGKETKRLWFLPAVPAVFFLAGAWMLFDRGETAFILYASVYLVLGLAAMAVSAFLKKKAK